MAICLNTGSANKNFSMLAHDKYFGKTSVLNMLGTYYCRAYDAKELFDHLKIHHSSTYPTHLNQYNVINLCLNNLPDAGSTYEDYKKIYDSAGFKTILCSNADKSGTEEIKALLSGKVSAFTGNTGVGKSTLLNSVDENLMLKTGETSKKLGRGKHTTRHSELFKVCGGYVADTPGFSSLEFERLGKVMKEDLFDCFRENAGFPPVRILAKRDVPCARLWKRVK